MLSGFKSQTKLNESTGSWICHGTKHSRNN